jgi:hypothetical protein
VSLQIACERAGETVDRTVLDAFTKMMTALGKPVYAAHLEKPFLDASRAHFECAPVCCRALCVQCLSCVASLRSITCCLHFAQHASTRAQGRGAAAAGVDIVPRLL